MPSKKTENQFPQQPPKWPLSGTMSLVTAGLIFRWIKAQCQDLRHDEWLDSICRIFEQACPGQPGLMVMNFQFADASLRLMHAIQTAITGKEVPDELFNACRLLQRSETLNQYLYGIYLHYQWVRTPTGL